MVLVKQSFNEVFTEVLYEVKSRFDSIKEKEGIQVLKLRANHLMTAKGALNKPLDP